MKPITCLATLSAMLCAAGRLPAAPQNPPAALAPQFVEARWQSVQVDPETQIKTNLEARRAAEQRRAQAQRQAAITDAQAAQSAITEYQRAMSLVTDPGTAGRSDRPLLIRYSETDPKSLAAMNEDMNIMARILEKAVRQNLEDKQPEAMGIRLMTVSVPDGARNIQIEGYGAVFQLGVNFPLVGPAEKTDDAADKEPTNSAWDETRRELYGPRGRGGRRGGPLAALPVFDPKRVEGLENSILDALKNASNVRNLKSDESVTVVVTSTGRTTAVSGFVGGFGVGGFGGGGGVVQGGAFGGASGTAQPGAVTVTADKMVYDSKTGSMTISSGTGSNAVIRMTAGSGGQRGLAGAGTESVLTIRAKKSDIDAFAKGKLSLDEFRNRASVQIY